MDTRLALVIPLFNEENRFSKSYFDKLVSMNIANYIFVNDGSSDGTQEILNIFVAGRTRCKVLSLKNNVGKAEALRLGMLLAIEDGFEYVGYLDADGAFDPFDIARLTCLIGESQEMHNFDAIISSRVQLRGRHISRSGSRHYLGRVIATLIGSQWKNSPYDSQSGFKLFRVSPQFKLILEERFRTRWFLDVELLMRLEKDGFANVWEEPLMYWNDIPGSKINLKQCFRIAYEILLLKGWILKEKI
jgi:dolichyl-phosphate beta-glucosyltransferase